jgi:hypothetical protein
MRFPARTDSDHIFWLRRTRLAMNAALEDGSAPPQPIALAFTGALRLS